MYLVFFSLLYRRYEGNEKTELTWLFENKHRSQSPRMKNDREIQVNFFIVVSALVSRTICWSPEFSCCALKISLGILKRSLKVFSHRLFCAAVSHGSLACLAMHWFFIDILANLTLVFRADWQQFGQLLSIRLNYWMLFYIIMFMPRFMLYYGYLFMMLYQMYDVLTVLLDNVKKATWKFVRFIVCLASLKLFICQVNFQSFPNPPYFELFSIYF